MSAKLDRNEAKRTMSVAGLMCGFFGYAGYYEKDAVMIGIAVVCGLVGLVLAYLLNETTAT